MTYTAILYYILDWHDLSPKVNVRTDKQSER